MLGTTFPDSSFLPPDDGAGLLAAARPLLRGPDLLFGNCEGVFLDARGSVNAKDMKGCRRCFAFRQPTRYARYLASAGFDIVSLANNHSNDFGEDGRLSTVDALDRAGIACAGIAARPVARFTRHGLSCAVVAFAPGESLLDMHDIPAARRLIAHLDSTSDIVIVSFHGGAEGARHARVRNREEWFFGEDRGNVVAFAHAAVEAGGDIIVGQGPHVPRALELYRGRIIAYSLGNFCTYGPFSLRGTLGLTPLLTVRVDCAGRFVDGRLLALWQEGKGGPRPDPTGAVVARVAFLTRRDFPRTPLDIAADGRIRRRPR